MAALKDIKRKITAVQKTKQITRAMNMVAASKFKAAQMRMENFRPYAVKFMEVLNSLALRVDASQPSPARGPGTEADPRDLHDIRPGTLRRIQHQPDQGH